MLHMDENDTLSSFAEWAATETLVEAQPSLPAHLVQLPGGPWAIWRWIGLRSAGFPIDLLLQLGDPGCAAAADRLRAAEDRLQYAQDALLDVLRGALEDVDAEQRPTIVKAIQQLKKRRVPAAPILPVAEVALTALAEATVLARGAAADFHQASQAALAQTGHALAAIARDPRFRTALTWQNRHALHTGVDSFLHKLPATTTRSSKYRQHEALIVNYVQRYCAKNDTIGFFGPVGWARVADNGEAARIQPGAELLATRTVYFDGWCIDALAEALAKDDALDPWLVPRRLPHIHVDGAVLYIPLAPPCPLPVAQAAVLRGCDGERTARQLAHDLLKNPANGLRSEAEVYAILKKLRALRRIAWTLEVPAEGLHPERSLRQRLQQVEEPRARSTALSTLAELEQAREVIAGAASDPDRLDQAMEDLEATFTRLTGTPATRRAGATYAGRTLVYEDCRRDVEVILGPGVVEALGPPLTLMLTSARWFTYEAAQLYHKAFESIYAELARKVGSRTVEFTSFWFKAHPLFFGKDAGTIAPLVNELQERWAAILDLPLGQHRVEYADARLRERVLAAFDAPHPGWPAARYHSPDIMIAAASAEAINQGQFQCVLGELHPGANTLKTALFVGQHPAPHELFQALESDLPEPQVVIVGTREEGGPTLRLSTALLSPQDFRFVFAHDSCGIPAAQALPIGAFVVEAEDATLVARTRDGSLRFDIIELLGEFLMAQSIHHFNIIRPARHTPRISIDKLVICREAWRFMSSELPFVFGESEADRFTGIRRWAHITRMPRFVFVKTPTEKKPFYVDFESIIALDLFAKAIRRAASDMPEAPITVTEMLPDPSQTWLPDREGKRYTCELRVVAVDQGYTTAPISGPFSS
jgi:Lantibiotic dehydratase, N terminus